MQAFVYDFDGTIANTFVPSPNGIGVNDACRMAVGTMFGADGFAVFDEIGGLRNRSPLDFMRTFLAA